MYMFDARELLEKINKLIEAKIEFDRRKNMSTQSDVEVANEELLQLLAPLKRVD